MTFSEPLAYYYCWTSLYILITLLSLLVIVHTRGLLMVIWEFIDDRTDETKKPNLWYDKLFWITHQKMGLRNYIDHTHLGGYSTSGNSRTYSILCQTFNFTLVSGITSLVWPAALVAIVVIGFPYGFILLLREGMRGKKKIGVLVNYAHEHKDKEIVEVDVKTEVDDIVTGMPVFRNGEWQ